MSTNTSQEITLKIGPTPLYAAFAGATASFISRSDYLASALFGFTAGLVYDLTGSIIKTSDETFNQVSRVAIAIFAGMGATAAAGYSISAIEGTLVVLGTATALVGVGYLAFSIYMCCLCLDLFEEIVKP